MATSSKNQSPTTEGDDARPGAGVGTILRGARLTRDEELREVSSALRVRLPYLEAIEDGRIEDLPGITYGIGFVRAYAEHLGLDSNDVVARFKNEVRGLDRKTLLQFPEPLPGNRVPGGALILIVLLLAGSVYGGWLYTSSQNMTLIEAVEEVPKRLMALIEDDPSVTSQSTTEDLAPSPAPLTSAPVADEENLDVTPQVDPAPQPETGADGQRRVEPATESSADTFAADTLADANDVVTEPQAVTDQEPASEPMPTPASGHIQRAGETSETETVATETAASLTQEAPAAETRAPATPAPPQSTAPPTPTPPTPAPPTPALPTPEPPAPESPTPAPIAAPTPAPVPATPTTAPDPTPEQVLVAEPAPEPEAESAAAPAVAESSPEPLPQPSAPPEVTSVFTPPSNSQSASGIVEEELQAPPEEPNTGTDEPVATSALTDTSSSEGSSATAPAATQVKPPAETPEAQSEIVARVEPTEAQVNRIFIQATSESWIQVKQADGTVLVEKLMLPGEFYRVPDQSGLVLDTGNAGVLKLIVNGTTIPPLGNTGDVIRGISLDADSLLP